MDLLSKRKKSAEQADEQLIAAVILALLENEDQDHTESLLPSLLCTSANCGFEGIVREVTPRLKCPNPADYDMRTPLHLAAETGDLQIVRILVKNGADVNCKDRFGATPLMCAILHEKYKVADYLKSNGATLKMMDEEAAVDILFSVVFNNDIDMLECLYNCGLNFLAADYDGRSVFGQACDVGSKGILNFLNSKELEDVRRKDGQLRDLQSEKTRREDKKDSVATLLDSSSILDIDDSSDP